MILVYTLIFLGGLGYLNVVGVLHQEIAQAADAAVCVYIEVIPFDEKRDQGLANAMRVGA